MCGTDRYESGKDDNEVVLDVVQILSGEAVGIEYLVDTTLLLQDLDQILISNEPVGNLISPLSMILQVILNSSSGSPEFGAGLRTTHLV